MEQTQKYKDTVEYLKNEYTLSELRDKLEEYESYDSDDVDNDGNLIRELFILQIQFDMYINAIKGAITELKNDYDPEHLAAAEYLGEEPDDITEENYSHYGLRVFSYGSQEVAVGDDDAANEAAEEYIKDTLWAFNAEFIAEHTQIGYREWFVNAIKALQESKYEDANSDLMDMIEDIDSFVEDAISADTRGHFLASYDSEENDIEIDGTWYYVYRIN